MPTTDKLSGKEFTEVCYHKHEYRFMYKDGLSHYFYYFYCIYCLTIKRLSVTSWIEDQDANRG